MRLIDKDTVIAEITKIYDRNRSNGYIDICNEIDDIISFIENIEVKDVDLNNGIQLTWEDMRELYIIFAEVDTEIEFCKCDIKMYETIGYYQEVLKRFKARKVK